MSTRDYVPPGERHLKPGEAAHITGLSTWRLARLADRGALAVIKPQIGQRHRLYRESEIRALAAEVARGRCPRCRYLITKCEARGCKPVRSR